MKTGLIGCSLLALMAACLLPVVTVYGEPPAKVSAVAAAQDLKAEAEADVDQLAEYLQSSESYREGKDRAIQTAGVLACVAQALAEHPEKSQVKVSAAALRDAALALRDAKSYEDAKQSLATAKQALAGMGAADATVEYDWSELIDMHHLMEAVNFRTSRLRRVVRRSRDPEKDSLHATTLAVLALATHRQTDYVENEADLPKWEAYSRDFQQNMTKLAEAIKKQDRNAGRDLFRQAARSCSDCHKDFRME